MIQINKALLVAAILVSPVLSIPLQVTKQELVARDSDLGKGIFRRELDSSLDVRELIDELDFREDALVAREPHHHGHPDFHKAVDFFKKVAHEVGDKVKKCVNVILRRDIDEA